MNTSVECYAYVGPTALREACRGAAQPIYLLAELLAQLPDCPSGTVVAVTFVIDLAGYLRVADRHSEHVACAGGQPVMSAGELFLRVTGKGVEVIEASNQSTGYCPESESWPAVAAALDRLGVAHPGRFTTALLFRLCPGCGERCTVKDEWFVCATCGSDLPQAWNFTSRRPS